MANASFDISTGVDLQEVDNAVNQAAKEIATRYDFKGTHCTVELDRTAAVIKVDADDQYRLQAVGRGAIRRRVFTSSDLANRRVLHIPVIFAYVDNRPVPDHGEI